MPMRQSCERRADALDLEELSHANAMRRILGRMTVTIGAGIAGRTRRRSGGVAARGERLASRETGGQARKLRRNGVNDRGARCRMRHT